MAPDQIVQQFARYLASITDDAERARVVARARMLAMQEAPEESFEPPIRSLAEYLATPIEVPPVLVQPSLIVRGGINVTVGRAGKGKTVMNLNRMLRWSAGLPMFEGWHDPDGRPYLAPERPLRILIVENEGAAGMFHRQIGVMLHAQGFMREEDRETAKENTLIWGEGGYSGLKLDDPNKLNGLRAGIEKHEPDLVFIEPFRSLWAGEENSATEMQVVVDALVGIATDYNCGVQFAHHENKGGENYTEKMSAARGSTVLEGIVTVMENFESVKGGEYRELSWSKVRYQDPDRPFPAPVRMEWVPDSWYYKWVPLSDLEEALLGCLLANSDEPMTITGLCEELDEKQHKVRPIMKRLADEGRVKKMPSQSGPGGSTGVRYRLPTEEANGGMDF